MIGKMYNLKIYYKEKVVLVKYNDVTVTFLDIKSIKSLTDNIIEWTEGYKQSIFETPYIEVNFTDLILKNYEKVYASHSAKQSWHKTKDDAFFYLFNIILVTYFGNKEHLINLKKGNYFVFEFFPTYHTSTGTYMTRMVQIFQDDEFQPYSISKKQSELRNKSQSFSFYAKIKNNVLIIITP